METVPSTAHPHALGAYGEQLAARHLIEQGLVVLERNWQGPSGEIDLVLRDGAVLVVCEVKTRSSTAFGDPLEGVTEAKLERLRRLAAEWLTERRVRVPEVRIDMVGVLRPRRGSARIEHVRGIG